MNDDTAGLEGLCVARLEAELSEPIMMMVGETVEDDLLGEELLAEGEEPPSEISIFRESRENRLEVVSQHPG